MTSHHPNSLHTVTMALLAALAATGARSQQPGLGSCYYPGEVWARDQHPCDLHSEISLCCPMGWTCFSNNLCIVTDPHAASADIGSTSRGTCTNPQWDEEICGSSCLDEEDGYMISCGNDTWCCGSDVAGGRCNCDSGQGTFTVEAGKAVALVGLVGNHFTVTTGTAVPTSTGPVVKPSRHATTSSSAAASSSTASSAAASTSSAPSTSASPRSSSSSSTSLNAAAASTATSSNHTTSTTSSPPLAKILGPIFGVLALALLIALIWFLWRRRARRRDQTPSPSPEPYPEPMPVGPTADNAHKSLIPTPPLMVANPITRPINRTNGYPPMAANPIARPTNRNSGYPPMAANPIAQPTNRNSGYSPMAASAVSRPTNRNSGYTPIFAPSVSEQGRGQSQVRPNFYGQPPPMSPPAPAMDSRGDPSMGSWAAERRQSLPRKPVPGSPPPMADHQMPIG